MSVLFAITLSLPQYPAISQEQGISKNAAGEILMFGYVWIHVWYIDAVNTGEMDSQGLFLQACKTIRLKAYKT